MGKGDGKKGIMNNEQGITNFEVLQLHHSIFLVRLFDIF